MVRVSIGALATERKHVEELWAALRRAAEHSQEDLAALRSPPRPRG